MSEPVNKDGKVASQLGYNNQNDMMPRAQWMVRHQIDAEMVADVKKVAADFNKSLADMMASTVRLKLTEMQEGLTLQVGREVKK